MVFVCLYCRTVDDDGCFVGIRTCTVAARYSFVEWNHCPDTFLTILVGRNVSTVGKCVIAALLATLLKQKTA